MFYEYRAASTFADTADAVRNRFKSGLTALVAQFRRDADQEAEAVESFEVVVDAMSDRRTTTPIRRHYVSFR